MRYIALLAIILLSGCSLLTKEEADFACPKTGFIEDASTVTFMAPKGVTAEAVIQGFSGDCSLKDKTTADVTLSLPFVAKRGAAGTSLTTQQFPYFIAVLSPEEKVLQRQTFSAKIDFDNTGIGNSLEEHTIKIPLAAEGTAGRYKVVIGFALTPEQLQHNKEKR